MAGDMQDMLIADSYHKAKRTLFLYSGALIVLFFANSTNAVAPWFGLEMSLRTLTVLLWFTGLYYFITFILEWRLAQRLNSPLMAGGNFSRVDERLGEISEKIRQHFIELESLLTTTSQNYKILAEGVSRQSSSSQLLNVLQRWISDANEIIGRASTSPPFDGNSRTSFDGRHAQEVMLEKLQRAMSEAIESPVNDLVRQSQLVFGGVNQIEQALVKCEGTIQGFQGNLSGLARHITRERKTIFYALDLGVACLLFGIGANAALAKALIGFWIGCSVPAYLL